MVVIVVAKIVKRRINKRNKKLLIFLMVLFFGISCLITFFSCVLLSPKIEIAEKEIVLQYGEHFQEPEYSALLNNKDVSSKVKIEGNVDESKLGTYELFYDIKYSIFEDKEKVVVKVVDEMAPLIELVGGESVLVCPNKEYEELGFKASDNYDGDLTDKVIVTKGEHDVTYKVSDSSSNSSKVVRTVEFKDVEKPSIHLNGSENVTLYLGSSYHEDGYTANDNCDGDISSKVQVSGEVNTSRVGSYTITYRVSDSSNNEAVVTRNVRVIQKSSSSGGGSGRGIVYLTFDDGPNEGTTNVILDILKEEGVSATFFVTCNGPDYLIKRMHDEGHTVALHTASHNYNYVYASEANYFADLKRISDHVERITGEKSMIIRFPGGSSNTVSRRLNSGIMTRLTAEVRARGYHYFDWNVDSNDAAGAGTSAVYSNVTQNISFSRENVVLMHDVKTTTRDAIRNIIRYGKANGFTFRKITYDTVMVTHGVNN